MTRTIGWRAAAAIAFTVAGAAPGHAALSWDWTYSAAGIAASGTLTTTDAADGAGFYAITGIAGSRNGIAITGLQPAGTAIPGNAPFAVDDLISQSGPQLTEEGFGFALADGTYANPYYADFLSPAVYQEVFRAPPFGSTPGPDDSEVPVTFFAAPVDVPEPGTAALVALAMSGLLALSRVGGTARPARPLS